MATEAQLRLRNEWAGFDLVKVGGSMPVAYRFGDLTIISGCITTVSPMKNQAGWDLTVAYVDPRCSGERPVAFFAPTAMSRYEGIYQNGTSVCLKPDGNLTINFGKLVNPMVLHFWGLAFLTPPASVELIPIPLTQHQSKEWTAQSTRSRAKEGDGDYPGDCLFETCEISPLGAHRWRDCIFLQGELKDATFGLTAQTVARLPEGMRPRRELRCLAYLLKTPEDGGAGRAALVEQTIAVTLRPDGVISVQGGKVLMSDNKGCMRQLPNKKKGRLCMDGLRFSLVDGEPIVPGDAIRGSQRHVQRNGLSAKIGYLLADTEVINAVCVRQGEVAMLEGHVVWNLARPPNPKQVIATLPPGCWPNRRETFFTRGGSDLEERRRVDIDKYGRIFCPEGIPEGRLELTGIMYVAAERSDSKPLEPTWDDLKLHYHRSDANVTSASFDGHELLESFVRRCNHHEWGIFEFDLGRHARRKMLLPMGEVKLRGHHKWDTMDIGYNCKDFKIWRDVEKDLASKHGITTFHTLLHLSDGKFNQIANNVTMREDDRRALTERRRQRKLEWADQREDGLTFERLHSMADEIVEQMFEHWDFRAQLKGALVNDFRPPQTIEHLFPQKRNGRDSHIKKLISAEETPKFEEIRQFFHLYETTGANMTHCCLMGSQDMFTTTGKWHFPDAPDVQRQLFESIAWLFPRKMYCYMVERQTVRFPFIEDLDIQVKTDWERPMLAGEDGSKRRPPDELIMNRPMRDENGKVYGDPGEFMRRRAISVHMVYPHLEYLEAIVYSASGYNKGKDMLKTSFHLVWPQLIVDPDRAPVIRHVTLGLFAAETRIPGSFLARLQNRLLELHESNNWELVFDNTTIHAKNGLRMPYNDKGSSIIESEKDRKAVKDGTLSKSKAFKKRVREGRPSVAVGKLRFEFDKDPYSQTDVVSRAEWIQDEASMEIWEWIHQGTCRRDPNDPPELTAWQIGPDVLEMLPTKPGEEFCIEGEKDGEGGHWVTHKPFPHIRRFQGSAHEFYRGFSEALRDEQEALQDEEMSDVLRQTLGSWVHVTDSQALWRSSGAVQCEAKVPDKFWGLRSLRRPAEVYFSSKRGKVVIDGSKDATAAILRALKQFTRPDDNAVMPIYDLEKISGVGFV